MHDQTTFDNHRDQAVAKLTSAVGHINEMLRWLPEGCPNLKTELAEIAAKLRYDTEQLDDVEFPPF